MTATDESAVDVLESLALAFQQLAEPPDSTLDHGQVRDRAWQAIADARRVAEHVSRVRAEVHHTLDMLVASMAETDDLRRAMVSRSRIDVAKGIVMATLDCDEDQAFARLCALSQRRGQKLRHLADEIVQKRSVLAPDASDENR